MVIKIKLKIFNLIIFTFLISLVFTSFILAVNFGDSSPDSGEADAGNVSGIFNTLTGSFTDTRSNNDIYFGVGRSIGASASANLTLMFNISVLSTSNSSIKITQINVSSTYCHARRVDNTCNGIGGASPQGTAGTMNVLIYNVSGNNWVDIGDITATTTATERTDIFTLSNLANYSTFINSGGLVNVSLQFVWSGSGRSAFLNDFTQLIVTYDAAPSVVMSSPANNTLADPSSITFSCSASDDNGLANITLFHNFGQAFAENTTTLVGGTSNSTTFTLTNAPENVNGIWACRAADTVNLTRFAPDNFTIDTSALNISIIGCGPNSNIDPNQSVVCNATVLDNTGVSSVRANVTMSNTTVISVSVSNFSTNYFFNFSGNTSITGRYNITWFANDTLNNNKTDNTSFFTVGNTAPNVSLVFPANGFNTSRVNQSFRFNVTDNSDTSMSCSLIFDNANNQTNSSVQVSVNTNLSVSNIADGQHNWSVSCTDSGSLSDQPANRNVTIDTKPPLFISLTTDPSSPDGLDPSTDILVKANVTDNTTAVNRTEVWLRIKRSTQNTFELRNMSFNTSSNFFELVINEPATGIYNLSINATDIVGNQDLSNNVNITLARERTWRTFPENRIVLPASNFSLDGSGVLRINNSGDFTLIFNTTSNYSSTSYNESENFNLNAGAIKHLNVSATAGTTVLTRFNLNITAVDATTPTTLGEPPSRIINGTIVVAPDQPILVVDFLSVPTAVTREEVGITIQAQMENIGQGNATNVTFSVTLPSGWNVTSGNSSITIANFTSGDISTMIFVASVATDAPSGSQLIVANASGGNQTGTDLQSLSLIFADERTVIVNTIGPTLGGLGGSGAGAAAAGAGAAAAAGGGVPFTKPELKRTLFTEEFLQTKEIIELVRGESDTFPLKVTNVFGNTSLSDVKLNIKGYLSQYLSSHPTILNNIGYAESKNFTIRMLSPAYFTKGVYNLIFEITGTAGGKFTITRNNTVEIVTTFVDFTEYRNVTLVIYELHPSQAKYLLNRSSERFNAMKSAGFPLKKASKLWDEIQLEYELLNWYHMSILADELQKLHDTSFEAYKIIKELEYKIIDAKKSGLDVSSTEEMLILIKSAFDREDFETAKKRGEEARLIQFLEVKGAFNLPAFLARYWWALLIVSMLTSASAYVIYRKLIIQIIDQRIKNLITEELNINELIKELQDKCFKEKLVSLETYHRTMYEYEYRLEQIKSVISRLRTKRIGILEIEDQLFRLKREKTSLFTMMKQAQENYFVQQNISKSKYDMSMEEYKFRLSEIEEEIMLLEVKLAKLTLLEKGFDRDIKLHPSVHSFVRKLVYECSKKFEHTIKMLNRI